MKDSKAYIALQTLNVYELNRFKKFVNSPYFNVNSSLIQLFDLYNSEIRSEDSHDANLDKEDVWIHVFPQEKFNGIRLRKLNSDFLRLLEQFLAQEQFENNPLHRANYLLKALSEKQIEKLYKGSITTARRLSNQQLERTASYYYYQYQIEKNLYSLTIDFDKKTKIKSNTILTNLEEIGGNLDIFYLTEKMRYYYTFLTLRNIAPLEKEVFPITHIVNEVKKLDYTKHPPLAIYYQIYLTFSFQDEEEHFQDLKKLINIYLEIFPKNEAKDIYESILNYCIAKVNKGNQEYFKEMFELFEYGLNSRILIPNDKLDPANFRNISITALRLGKYAWTDKFISEYNHLLEPKYRQNAVIFNRARLETYKKNFEKVIELLREVTFEDLVYELSSKALQIVAYYELNEQEVLISFLSSFNTFLRRNTKIPERRKNNYKKLIYFTRKLIKLTPRMKPDIKKLRTEINDSENFADKPWLLEKIAELQGIPQKQVQGFKRL